MKFFAIFQSFREGDSLILFSGEKNEPFGLLFFINPFVFADTSPIFCVA